MTGQKLSHYEILNKLGEDGMGEVYRARDSKLNREVALMEESFFEWTKQLINNDPDS